MSPSRATADLNPFPGKPSAQTAAPPPLWRRRSFQAALLCLAAFLAAGAVAHGVFDALPHLEDEQANVFQAGIFARFEVAAPAPPSRDAFFIPFTIMQNGIWFGKYTPGYPLVLALGVLAGAPWIVNALASALVLWATYLIGRDLFGADAGVLGAALGAVSPAFVILSGSLLPHPVASALLAFFAWGLLRARRSGEKRAALYSLLAGSALGLAVLSRPWTALAIASPFIALAAADGMRAVWGWIGGIRKDMKGRTGNIQRVRTADKKQGRPAGRPYIQTYGPLILSCIAVSALLPLFNWAVTGSPLTNTYTLWWPYDTVGFGPGIGRDEGHTLVLAFTNAKLDLAAFRTALLGWPAPFGIPLVLLPLLAGLILAPRSRRDFLLLAPPLTLILFHLAYWARAGYFYGGRYYSEGMPFLWLLAARGLLKLAAGTWRTRLVRLALPVLLAWGIAFQIQPRFFEGRGLYGITGEAPAEVAAAGLNNALVFVRTGKWTDYANLSCLNSPWLDGEVVFVRDMGSWANADIIAFFPGRTVYLFDFQRTDSRLSSYEIPPYL